MNTLFAGVEVPTGTVQFFDGSIPLTTPFALVNGSASLTTSKLTVGSHAISATYHGTPDFDPSTSPIDRLDVSRVDTTTWIDGPTGAFAVGTPVLLRATVTPVSPGTGVPTGDIVFRANGVVVGVVPTVNGMAEFTFVPSVADSAESVTANYRGSDGFVPSLSQPLAFSVTQAHSYLTLEAVVSANASGLTLVGTTSTPATGIVPTGTLSFYRTSRGRMSVAREFVTVPLTGNQASVYLGRLSSLNRTFFVRYNGDANFLPSQSQSLRVTRNTFSTVPTLRVKPVHTAVVPHMMHFKGLHRGR